MRLYRYWIAIGTARVVEENRPTAVLALGDTQYEHGEYANFLGAYEHSWGRFKQLTRPAVGNHEYTDPAGPAAGYFRYFGSRAGNPAKGYYSFDVGSWHVVALNSNCGAAGSPSSPTGRPNGPGSRGTGQPPPTLHPRLLHHPYRSSTGTHVGKPELKHLWAQHGRRWRRPGPRRPQPRLRAPQAQRTAGDVDMDGAPWTVVAGSGGRSLVPISSVHPNSVARAAVYGVFKMILYPDRWVGAHKGTDGKTRDLRVDRLPLTMPRTSRSPAHARCGAAWLILC